MEKPTGAAGGFSGEMIPNNGKTVVDLFYEELCKLNESSGLSLLFNLRQAKLDLHRFYKEVTKRGGFCQVTKTGKWHDVALASVSNSESCVSMSAAQLQNVYEILILKYELLYSCKRPDRANIWPTKSSLGGISPSISTGKRKHCDGSSPILKVRTSNQDKKDYSSYSWQLGREAEKVLKNAKEFIVDDPNIPQKPRTGYHIFLRLETHRLRMILGDSSSSQNLREMAVAAWRRLPEKDKLPYIEASKMDKERYEKEKAAYNQVHEQKVKSQTLFSNTASSMLNFSTSMEPDDVYHVSLEDDSEKLHSPDESVVELAIEAMKKAKSNESIFQIDWDNGHLNIPS